VLSTDATPTGDAATNGLELRLGGWGGTSGRSRVAARRTCAPGQPRAFMPLTAAAWRPTADASTPSRAARAGGSLSEATRFPDPGPLRAGPATACRRLPVPGRCGAAVITRPPAAATRLPVGLPAAVAVPCPAAPRPAVASGGFAGAAADSGAAGVAGCVAPGCGAGAGGGGGLACGGEGAGVGAGAGAGAGGGAGGGEATGDGRAGSSPAGST